MNIVTRLITPALCVILPLLGFLALHVSDIVLAWRIPKEVGFLNDEIPLAPLDDCKRKSLEHTRARDAQIAGSGRYGDIVSVYLNHVENALEDGESSSMIKLRMLRNICRREVIHRAKDFANER